MQFSHEIIVPEAGYPFKIFLFEGGSGNYYREKHWHRSVEIFAVCGGELDFYIDDRKCHLEPDDFMIVNSNEVHAIASPLPNETIVLQIPLKMFANYFTGDQFIWFSHEPGRRDEHFMDLLKELYQVHNSGRTGCDMKAKSIFYQLMYLLVKDFRLKEVDADSIRKNKNLNRLSLITSYIKSGSGMRPGIWRTADTALRRRRSATGSPEARRWPGHFRNSTGSCPVSSAVWRNRKMKKDKKWALNG